MSQQPTRREYDINPSTYDWSVRVFRTLRKMLSVHIKLHSEKAQIEEGSIFLFNHFARFETFIPQYLIYEETGAYCCSVASAEFFEEDDVLANYLRTVGVIPHDHPSLFPMLAEQILRGRKIIIFPEGGMVKDRQVLDSSGEYSVYSRTAKDRRKHHKGAAVLALGLDAFKKTVKQAYHDERVDLLQHWTDLLELKDVGALLAATLRPTLIVPASITFYPIRVSDNILRKGVELLNEGLTRRHSEELLIEGNLLLKETDMDIRFGEPIDPSRRWCWWERQLLAQQASDIRSLDDWYVIPGRRGQWRKRLFGLAMRKRAREIRNEYMHRIYISVTVNMSHLASSVIKHCVKQGFAEIDRDLFHKALYLAIKRAQRLTSVNLHRSLMNPEAYRHLIDGRSVGLDQFIYMAESSGLIEPCDTAYRFLPKLRENQEFDEIRMENMVAVYVNEVQPLREVTQAVAEALTEAETLNDRRLAELYFDDEIRSWQWDKAYFAKPWFDEINQQETASASAAPFLLQPKNGNGVGIVLVHGFLSSPAEVRSFGDALFAEGFTVIGVRLKGHGTSPVDLREKSWEEWMESIGRAYEIMEALTDRIFMIGFSTGGALVLRYAADQPDCLIGVVAISVPIKFHNPTMMFVPLVHGTNTLVRWLSSYEGIRPYIVNDPEHPDVNYRNIPVRGLYELRRLITDLEGRLADVHCPTLLVQGDKDPVVVPKSAEIIFEKLGTKEKELLFVHSERHSILMENADHTQEKIMSYLTRIFHKLCLIPLAS